MIKIPKKKVYKNGATLIYKHFKRRHTSVVAGFVFGKNRDNYPEPTAHFCEHMFFKETQDKSVAQLKDEMLNVFSMYNGRTNLFYTEIDFCRSNKAIEPCFKLAAEMLLNTKYSSKTIKTEKGVIKQELVRKLNNPDAISYYAFSRCIYSKYNLNTNVLGSEEEIEQVSAKSLKKFKDETFISQNFIITIEGGISFNKAKHLAEKYFINKLKSNPEYPVDQSITYPVDKPGNLNIEYFQFNKANCKIGIKLDKEIESVENDNYISMLCSICNNLNGKLMSKLRDNGLVYGVSMWADCIPENYMIGIDFGCSNENVNKVIDKIGELFRELKTTKIDQSLIEIKKENKKLSKDENIRRLYPSNLFRNYLFYKDDIFSKKLRKESKKIYEDITSDDIQTLCQKIFNKPENIYMSILTNASPESFYNYEEIQKILTSNTKPNFHKKQKTDKQNKNRNKKENKNK